MAFGFFNKIKEGLEKTRKSFVKNVESIVGINCIKQMLKSKRCSMRVIKWKKAVIKLDFANINFTFA